MEWIKLTFSTPAPEWSVNIHLHPMSFKVNFAKNSIKHLCMKLPILCFVLSMPLLNNSSLLISFVCYIVAL